MANKQKKSVKQNQGKSLEDYEKHLLLEIKKHREIARSAPLSRSDLRENSKQLADTYDYMHKHLRKFYFDL